MTTQEDVENFLEQFRVKMEILEHPMNHPFKEEIK